MNKQVLVAICVALIIVIGVVAFDAIRPPHMSYEPKKPEDLIVYWWLWFLNESRVIVSVGNDGHTPINITRVELIYLPNETLGLIWVGQATIEAGTGRWIIDTYLTEGEQLDFLNLLHEGKDEAIVRIEVETPKSIYTYYPEKMRLEVKPTSMEKKPENG